MYPDMLPQAFLWKNSRPEPSAGLSFRSGSPCGETSYAGLSMGPATRVSCRSTQRTEGGQRGGYPCEVKHKSASGRWHNASRRQLERSTVTLTDLHEEVPRVENARTVHLCGSLWNAFHRCQPRERYPFLGRLPLESGQQPVHRHAR